MAAIDTAVPPTPCSMTEFARWLGVNESSVRSAVKMGRLTDAVIGRDSRGSPVVLDVEAAAKEWEEQTRPYARAGRTVEPSKLAAATLRERIARAVSIELDTAKKSRDLLPAREVEHRWAGVAVQIRTGLLGLPTRARQRLPHLTAADVAELDRLVREILEEFAEQAVAKAVTLGSAAGVLAALATMWLA